MDALEPSEGMLKKLMGRGIYQKDFQTAIGFDKIEAIPEGNFISRKNQ